MSAMTKMPTVVEHHGDRWFVGIYRNMAPKPWLMHSRDWSWPGDHSRRSGDAVRADGVQFGFLLWAVCLLHRHRITKARD